MSLRTLPALFTFADGRTEVHTLDVDRHGHYQVADQTDALDARTPTYERHFQVRTFRRVEYAWHPDWFGPLVSPAWWFAEPESEFSPRTGRVEAVPRIRREFRYVEV